MIALLILGVFATLSKNAVSQWPHFDYSNSDGSSEEVADDSYYDIGGNDVWLELERKLQLLTNQNDDEEKFEMARGLPMAHGPYSCVEKEEGPFNLTSVYGEVVYPSYYYNITCKPAPYHKTKTSHHHLCKPPKGGGCVPIIKEMPVFNKKSQHCWKREENINVQIGCHCFK